MRATGPDVGPGRRSAGVSVDPPAKIPSRNQVARVLAALVQDDIRRDTGRVVPRACMIETDRLDEDGIGLDSLARLRAIATVTEFFGLAVTGVEDYLVVHPRLSAWSEIVEHHLGLRGGLTELTFTSSGSSGLTPKRATHRLEDLIAEVDAVATILDDEGAGGHPIRRVLASVPPQHIYGFLFSVLLPDRVGCAVSDLSELPPSAALRSAESGDLIVGTPYTWQLACDARARAGQPCLGLVSTAPSSPSLWASTRGAGVRRLVELYGSSETSGIGWRDAPDTPFALLPHLSRVGDRPTRRGSSLALQDRLDWVAADRFRLGSRLDGAVQVGGMNVAPAAVARVLAQVDGVADIAVRLAGDRLKAFVVPVAGWAQGTEILEGRLRDAAMRQLAPPARPMQYTFGPSLPRNAIGKPADWAADPAAPSPCPAAGAAPGSPG